MGIQFQQVDGLQTTFDSVSGNLQTQIDDLPLNPLASGTFEFSGVKTFISNVSCSGEAGLGVTRDNLYVYGYSHIASGLRVGRNINTIRSTTPIPDGAFQVTGGASYFEGDVNIRNAGQLIGGSIYGTELQITGAISGSTTLTSLTGTLEYLTSTTVTGATGRFHDIESTVFSGTAGSTGYFENVKITGNPTGFLRLHSIPYWDETGSIPAPATGTVFRSGNYLMIV